MRHKVATFKIGRSGAHRRAMLANMVSSLFEHGRIETTIVKAKAAASFAAGMPPVIFLTVFIGCKRKKKR